MRKISMQVIELADGKRDLLRIKDSSNPDVTKLVWREHREFDDVVFLENYFEENFQCT
jgi:hypothetical protein